ncbi:MAG: hypothetical protein ACR2HX_03415 [Pyrinomonadaceae bacterium]
MSEVKLNLIDAQSILIGMIHGSVADSSVAALSAEPETIAELEAALGRYIRPQAEWSPFASFRSGCEIDSEPWDAGLVIIDLAARIVATESTYSQPQLEGEVRYHDGTKSTDISVPYRLPPDWLFVNSVDAYRWSCDRRRQQRQKSLAIDARAVLYGPALLEFIAKSGVDQLGKELTKGDDATQQALAQEISSIHANWLMRPRDDLRGRLPREVLVEKREFIDRDLDTRCWQWTIQGEGPPCLAPNSFAYRFAGFGTHEWVVYYDLVRHLLWSATELWSAPAGRRFGQGEVSMPPALETLIARLEELKSDWLDQPQGDYEGKVPAIIIDNERRRLPQAMSAAEMIIDEDCECCRMLAADAEMGLGPAFWHLDGSHMDDGFAFSSCLTLEEWEAENRQREEFDREFNREWEERRQRIARGEIVDDEFNLDWSESSQPDPGNSDPDSPF